MRSYFPLDLYADHKYPEVHAYDTYMNGLLEAVLKAQADVGGSVILLSATLPMKQKQKLLYTYGLHTDPVENNSANTPTNKAIEKPHRLSPPKISSAAIASRVEIDVAMPRNSAMSPPNAGRK